MQVHDTNFLWQGNSLFYFLGFPFMVFLLLILMGCVIVCTFHFLPIVGFHISLFCMLQMFHFYCCFMCRCSITCFFVLVDILHPPVALCCRYFTILSFRLIFYILLFSMLYIIHFLLCVVDNYLLFFPMLQIFTFFTPSYCRSFGFPCYCRNFGFPCYCRKFGLPCYCIDFGFP